MTKNKLTEKTLMHLRQCLLPGNVQDGLDLEVPSWLVRDAVTALETTAALEQRVRESKTVLIDTKGGQRKRVYGQDLWDANEKLEQRVEGFHDALIWCSGSGDFQEGGKARVGWLKLCAPLLEALAEEEATPRPEPPPGDTNPAGRGW